MTIDYEEYYRPKPATDGWDGTRSARWHELGAVVKGEHLERLVRRSGRVPSGMSVLEVGCGDGNVLANLGRRGFGPLVGVEISETAVELARRNPAIESVMRFDGDSLPFEDCSFDLVLATHVLEHVEVPQVLLREMVRVSRSLVFVEVPLERNLAALRPHAKALARHVGHVQRFGRRDMRRLLAGAGLHVLGELSDPLPRHVKVFHDGQVRGTAKWLVRRVLVSLPGAESLLTVHYAALATRTGATIAGSAP